MNKPLHNILSTFIILWFLTIPVTSVSQDISQQIDSLKSLLPLSTNTSNSCKLYIELSKLHLGVNNELGIAYADSSLQIALDNDMYAMAFFFILVNIIIASFLVKRPTTTASAMD